MAGGLWDGWLDCEDLQIVTHTPVTTQLNYCNDLYLAVFEDYSVDSTGSECSSLDNDGYVLVHPCELCWFPDSVQFDGYHILNSTCHWDRLLEG